MNREQKLIDIMFEIVLTAAQGHFINKSDDEITEWVRRQLKLCGYEVNPCGSSHGVLKFTNIERDKQMKIKKCIVHGCTNYDDAGEFEGEFCGPCWEFITTGRGVYSQVFRNVAKHFEEYRPVYFELGKKAGKDEIQNAIIDILGLHDRFDKSRDL